MSDQRLIPRYYHKRDRERRQERAGDQLDCRSVGYIVEVHCVGLLSFF